jgi:hypothetical protein
MAIHAYSLDAATKVDDLPTTPNTTHFLAFVADSDSAESVTHSLESLWPSDAQLAIVVAPIASAFESVTLHARLPVIVAMYGAILLASTNDSGAFDSFIADVRHLSDMMPGSPA